MQDDPIEELINRILGGLVAAMVFLAFCGAMYIAARIILFAATNPN